MISAAAPVFSAGQILLEYFAFHPHGAQGRRSCIAVAAHRAISIFPPRPRRYRDDRPTAGRQHAQLIGRPLPDRHPADADASSVACSSSSLAMRRLAPDRSLSLRNGVVSEEIGGAIERLFLHFAHPCGPSHSPPPRAKHRCSQATRAFGPSPRDPRGVLSFRSRARRRPEKHAPPAWGPALRVPGISRYSGTVWACTVMVLTPLASLATNTSAVFPPVGGAAACGSAAPPQPYSASSGNANIPAIKPGFLISFLHIFPPTSI